jgi:hypothetical protein
MDKIKHAFDWYYNAMSASKAERLGPAHAVWNGFAAGYAAAEQAQQAESLTWKPGHRPPSVFKTSEAGRQYVADYFAKALRRHDFSSYIKGHLAADFACALSDGLHAMQQAQPPAVAVAVPDGWRNEVVPSKEFDSLFFWLYRCEEKGHLENCPDLVGPMDDYSRAMLSYPAKP